MKITELRLGNIVKVISSEYCKIDHISYENVKGMWKSSDGIISSTWTPGKGIEPIPLTEEWLVKLGFVEVSVYHPTPNNRAFERGYIHVKIYNSHDIKRIWYKDIVIDNDYFFIHQLQNLYFALTGEELIVK
jgi:hypothetical protein